MYHASKYPMSALTAASALFGLNAYRLTKEPLWIYGAAAIFAVIPFTFLAIMGVNKRLAEDEKASKPGTGVSESVASRLGNWVWRHRVRAALALLAAGLFYAAEGKPSTHVVKVVVTQR